MEWKKKRIDHKRIVQNKHSVIIISLLCTKFLNTKIGETFVKDPFMYSFPSSQTDLKN